MVRPLLGSATLFAVSHLEERWGEIVELQQSNGGLIPTDTGLDGMLNRTISKELGLNVD